MHLSNSTVSSNKIGVKSGFVVPKNGRIIITFEMVLFMRFSIEKLIFYYWLTIFNYAKFDGLSYGYKGMLLAKKYDAMKERHHYG